MVSRSSADRVMLKFRLAKGASNKNQNGAESKLLVRAVEKHELLKSQVQGGATQEVEVD